jgi:hypothetical protein
MQWYHKQQDVHAMLSWASRCCARYCKANLLRQSYLHTTVDIVGMQLFLQEKANREAEAARSAAQKDPLAQAPPPPRLEVRHAALAVAHQQQMRPTPACRAEEAAYSSVQPTRT